MAIVTSLGNGPMDSVQVGKAVFVKRKKKKKKKKKKKGIEPRTYSYPGRSGNHYSVSWVKINLVAIRHYIQVR